MFNIEWEHKALKQLRRIDNQDQTRILASTRNLENWPECQNVKALTNRDDYRLRVGNYRVLFTVAKSVKIIIINKVVKRDERTY